MAVLRRWHGYTLDGQDDHPSSMSTGVGYALHPVSGMPCFLMDQPAAAMTWAWGSLGNHAVTSFHIRFRLTALPSGTNTLISPQNSTPTNSWRATLGSTGTLNFQNASNSTVSGLAYTSLTTGVDYTYKGQVNSTTGAVAVRLWADGTPVDGGKSASSVTLNATDNFRVGQTLSSPVMPDYYVWDVILTDQTEWIEWDAVPPTAPSTNVAVIGDSLTFMGATGWEKFVARATGYDPADAAIFYYAASGKEILAADFVKRRTIEEDVAFARAQLGTVDCWIIALGTNDTSAGEATFRTRVETLLTELASETRVVWIGLAYKQESNPLLAFNTYLADEISAFGNAEYADWATYVYSPYAADDWSAADSIHMTDDGTPAEGYSRRADFYADQLSTLTPVTSTLSPSWHVRAPVASTLAPRWNVNATVGQTLSPRWHVRSLVAQTISPGWDVRAAVAAALAPRWDVYAAIASTLSPRWDVHSLVGSTFSPRWDVHGSVGSTFAPRWDIHATVTGSLSPLWDVHAAVLADLVLLWDVETEAELTPVLASLTVVWDVHQSVAADLDVAWDVRAAVAGSLAPRWDIRAGVTQTLAPRWDVHAPVTANLSPRWDVRQAITGSQPLAWDVHTTAASSLALSWAVRVLVARTLNLRWNVESDAPGTPIVTGSVAGPRWVGAVGASRSSGRVGSSRWDGSV